MSPSLQRDLERFRSVPRLEALESLRSDAARPRLRDEWTPGRLAFAAGAGALLFLAYSSVATGVAPALLGAVALVAGLVAASYLPRGGAPLSACGAAGVLSLVGAAWALQTSPGIAGGVLALGLVVAGLVQRVAGPRSC